MMVMVVVMMVVLMVLVVDISLVFRLKLFHKVLLGLDTVLLHLENIAQLQLVDRHTQLANL
jgi:hypothetical protein